MLGDHHNVSHNKEVKSIDCSKKGFRNHDVIDMPNLHVEDENRSPRPTGNMSVTVARKIQPKDSNAIIDATNEQTGM